MHSTPHKPRPLPKPHWRVQVRGLLEGGHGATMQKEITEKSENMDRMKVCVLLPLPPWEVGFSTGVGGGMGGGQQSPPKLGGGFGKRLN